MNLNWEIARKREWRKRIACEKYGTPSNEQTHIIIKVPEGKWRDKRAEKSIQRNNG